MNSKKVLITTALPYANGPLHLGHIFENIMADIWSRSLKMSGHEVYFFCADDTHGTPIMIEAQKRGITPEALIKQIGVEHKQDFVDFQISHTHYSSTHTEQNKQMANLFYNKMKQKGLIHKVTVDQLYCEHDKMFLPDRFVKGQCPKCHALDQNGDSCDICGATYTTRELIEPYCILCKNKPILSKTEQLVFKLNSFRDDLAKWLPEHTDKGTAQKMSSWLKSDLRDWDISRNAPYFGFPIPGEENKFFYVWLDAPMGYISCSNEFFETQNDSYLKAWSPQSDFEIYHFIGKDIIYFHTLFWPALLKTAELKTPSQVFVHGFISINGQKMSKSKGTFIAARDYLNLLPADHLRYYFASKLGTGQDDIDFHLEDFALRTNGELIGKIVNLFSRSFALIKHFNGELAILSESEKQLLKENSKYLEQTQKHYHDRNFHLAVDLIRELTDHVNKYFDQMTPWKLVKQNPAEAQKVLTLSLNKAFQIAVLLSPILPDLTERIFNLYHIVTPVTWNDFFRVFENQKLNSFEPLLGRIEQVLLNQLIKQPQNQTQASTDKSQNQINQQPSPARSSAGLKPEIDISAVDALDLRVAKVIEAKFVEGADKLISMSLDLGPLGTRHIFAGIRPAYPQPEMLIGKNIIVVANLKPRKMKFGLSEGMSLAAGPGGSDLCLVTLLDDTKANPGDSVK